MEKENKYIKLYQEENNLESFNYFWEKYHEYLQKACFKMIKNKFFSVPIEFDDLTSIIYFSICNTLRKFDTNQTKYTIGQALFTTAMSAIRKQAIKYTTNGHCILNKAISLDTNMNLANNPRSSNNSEEQWICDMDTENKILKFKLKTNNFHNQFTRKVLYFKAKGYKNKEIAKILNVNAKKISNTLSYLKHKFNELQ